MTHFPYRPLPKKRRLPPAGSAMIELALVLPILAALTFGVIEYGWVFLKVSEVNNAARQGVRVAIRPGATIASVQSAVSAVMTQADLATSGYRLTITPPDPNTVPTKNSITVAISLPYANVSLTGTGFLPLPARINESATMSKEGP